jgi:hypothetical protein
VPIYVFDSEKPRRSWDVLCGAYIRCDWNSATKRFVAGGNELSFAGTLLIHRSFFVQVASSRRELRALLELAAVADARPDLTIIVVSGDEQSNSAAQRNLYFRRTPVLEDFNEAADESFRRYLADFLETLAEGAPEFSRLEPRSVTDELLSIYVSAVAAEIGLDQGALLDRDQAQWSVAKSDFLRLARSATTRGSASERDELHAVSEAKWPTEIIQNGLPAASFLDALELVYLGPK